MKKISLLGIVFVLCVGYSLSASEVQSALGDQVDAVEADESVAVSIENAPAAEAMGDDEGVVAGDEAEAMGDDEGVVAGDEVENRKAGKKNSCFVNCLTACSGDESRCDRRCEAAQEECEDRGGRDCRQQYNACEARCHQTYSDCVSNCYERCS